MMVILFIFYGLGSPVRIDAYSSMEACKQAVETAQGRKYQPPYLLEEERMYWRPTKAEYLCIPAGS